HDLSVRRAECHSQTAVPGQLFRNRFLDLHHEVLVLAGRSEFAGFGLGGFALLKSNRATRFADWLKTPQNRRRRSGSAVLLRLLRLAGAFFSPLALGAFLPFSSVPAALAIASAASFSARNSLRLTILRAIHN